MEPDDPREQPPHVERETAWMRKDPMPMDPLSPPPPNGPAMPPPDAPRVFISPQQVRWAGVIGVALVGSVLAWTVSDMGLSETGLYFIGIPGLMALLLSMTPLPAGETTMSGTRKVVIAVLASAIIVREGFVCVVMAMPLVLFVGAIVMAIQSLSRSKNDPAGPGLQATMLAPVLLLAFGALEGVSWQGPTAGSGHEQRVIAISEAELLAAVAGSELPVIDEALFQLPFPRPTKIDGPAVAIGDQRVVHFTAGAMTLEIDEIVLDAQTDHIRWVFTEDTTPIGQWMDMHSITLSWADTPEGLDVAMDIDFDRRLSPGIYFGPLQNWGADEMADVLVDLLEANLRGDRDAE